MADTKDLTIQQGKTFSLPVRWENGDLVVRKPITAISLAFGAPRLTVASHGLPAGWRTYVTRCQGMKQINAANTPPRDGDYHPATVIDATTIELNDIDPVDDNGKEWTAYTEGGFLNSLRLRQRPMGQLVGQLAVQQPHAQNQAHVER